MKKINLFNATSRKRSRSSESSKSFVSKAVEARKSSAPEHNDTLKKLINVKEEVA